MQMCEQQQIGVLANFTNIKYLFFKGNWLEDLVGLGSLTNLRRLDLSSNKITSLPPFPVWARLTQLHFLELHQNLLQTLATLEGLAGCKSLLTLTCYWNPVSVDPDYRYVMLKLLPKLIALDETVMSDEEFIDDVVTLGMCRFGDTFGGFTQRYRLPAPPVVTTRMTKQQHHEMYLEQLATVHRMHQTLRPVVLLQRLIRGHWGRDEFREAKLLRTAAATRIKHNWVIHQNRKAVVTIVQAIAQQTMNDDADPNNNTWMKALDEMEYPEAETLWGLTPFDLALYFHPRHVTFFADLARLAVGLTISSEQEWEAAQISWASVRYIRTPAMLANHATRPQRMFPGALLRRDYPSRPFNEMATAKTCKVKAWAPSLTQVLRFVSLPRRCFSTSTKDQLGFKAFYRDSCAPPRARTHEKRDMENRLMRIVFPTAASRQRFEQLVRVVNATLALMFTDDPQQDKVNNLRFVAAGAPSLWFVPPDVVRRMTAPVAIQAAARGYLARQDLDQSLYGMLLCYRAARFIQLWWRWMKVKVRLEALTRLRWLLKHTPSPHLYADLDIVDQLDASYREPNPMFLEANVVVTYTEKGFIRWHTVPPPGVKAGCYEHRRLPKWVGSAPDEKDGLDSPELCESPDDDDPQGDNGDQGDESPRRLPTAGTVETEESKTSGQVAAEARDRAEDEEREQRLAEKAKYSKSEVPWDTRFRRLAKGDDDGLPLRSVVSVGILKVQRVERALFSEGVGRSPVGRRPVLKLTYASPNEAFNRLAVLFLTTWKGILHDFVPLYPAGQLLRREAAVALQCVFRGFRVRRWFKPRRRLLSKHLGTGIYETRKTFWNWEGNYPPAPLSSHWGSHTMPASTFVAETAAASLPPLEGAVGGSSSSFAMTSPIRVGAEAVAERLQVAREVVQRIQSELSAAKLAAETKREAEREELRTACFRKKAESESKLRGKPEQPLNMHFMRKVINPMSVVAVDKERRIDQQRQRNIHAREQHMRVMRRNEVQRLRRRDMILDESHKDFEELQNAMKQKRESTMDLRSRHLETREKQLESLDTSIQHYNFAGVFVSNMNILDGRSSAAEWHRNKELSQAASTMRVQTARDEALMSRERSQTARDQLAFRRRNMATRDRINTQTTVAQARAARQREATAMRDSAHAAKLLRAVSRPSTTPLSSMFDRPLDVTRQRTPDSPNGYLGGPAPSPVTGVPTPSVTPAPHRNSKTPEGGAGSRTQSSEGARRPGSRKKSSREAKERLRDAFPDERGL